MGGVPGWLPADLAVPEAAGAACLLCRLSTLPLAYLLSPIPPPPSRREGGGGDRGRKTAKVKNRPATKTIVPPPRRAPTVAGRAANAGNKPPAGDRAAPRRKKVRRRGANFQIPIDREAKRCYNVSTSAKGFFVVSGNLRHKSDTLPSQREVHGPRPGTRRRGQIF